MTSSAPVTDALLGILADASAELVKRRAEEIADTKTGVPHNLPVSAGVLVLWLLEQAHSQGYDRGFCQGLGEAFMASDQPVEAATAQEALPL